MGADVSVDMDVGGVPGNGSGSAGFPRAAGPRRPMRAGGAR